MAIAKWGIGDMTTRGWGRQNKGWPVLQDGGGPPRVQVVLFHQAKQHLLQGDSFTIKNCGNNRSDAATTGANHWFHGGPHPQEGTNACVFATAKGMGMDKGK